MTPKIIEYSDLKVKGFSLGIFDLLKQASIQCPTCQSNFEVGPDYKSITDSAGALLDKLSGMFSDNPYSALCEEIADQFDVAYETAVEMLASALGDEAVKDAVFDYIDDNGEDF